MKPTTKEAYQLLHDGVLALSEVEANGIRIDTAYLRHAIRKTTKRIDQGEKRLRQSSVAREWRKAFGRKTNFGSYDQLGTVLFEKMGYLVKDRTATGRPRTDEESLGKIDIPFVKRWLKLAKLKKARSTYLQGILREVHNGYLHPVFSLHLARTYRSSSDSPNFQNIPNRIPWIMKLVRRAFIPRPGHAIVEIDYDGAEVRVSCCYNKDPRLIAYVCDKSLDMHRDVASEAFFVPVEFVDKPLRHIGKNKFVFPQFYGDYYINCARNMWEAAEQLRWKLPDGTSIFDHLLKNGIRKLGQLDPDQKPKKHTFEKHIQEIEHAFWYERFKVYTAWKDKWWNAYQRKGGFRTLTGFVVNGVFSKNEVINSPVQGSAFHCLLWSLIRLVWWVRKHKSGAKIIGQIHDSIVADVPEKELPEFLAVAQQIMTQDIRRDWKWIIIPMEVEVEVSHDGQTWADKEKVEI